MVRKTGGEMKFKDWNIDYSNESLLIVWQESTNEERAKSKEIKYRCATPLEELMFRELQ